MDLLVHIIEYRFLTELIQQRFVQLILTKHHYASIGLYCPLNFGGVI